MSKWTKYLTWIFTLGNSICLSFYPLNYSTNILNIFIISHSYFKNDLIRLLKILGGMYTRVPLAYGLNDKCKRRPFTSLDMVAKIVHMVHIFSVKLRQFAYVLKLHRSHSKVVKYEYFNSLCNGLSGLNR